MKKQKLHFIVLYEYDKKTKSIIARIFYKTREIANIEGLKSIEIAKKETRNFLSNTPLSFIDFLLENLEPAY